MSERRSRQQRIVAASEINLDDLVPDVLPHNTMRFDVELCHVQQILDEGTVTKDAIAEAIRAAILKAVDETVGVAIKCSSVSKLARAREYRRTVMLHRESICFDLS